jgi:hypothetical protein
MKKGEAETALRALCHDWRAARGLSGTPVGELSGADFLSWIRKNYPQYLRFRSTMSVEDMVEMWFADEFGQRWRY